MRRLRFVFGVFFLLAAVGQAYCGKITGLVIDRQTKKPLSQVAVCAYAEGRSLCNLAASDNDGRFEIGDLPAGRYSVCVGQTENSRPVVTSAVVPASGEVEIRFVLSPSIEVEGDSWLQGYPVFYQSFCASGLGITTVKLKAFGPGRVVHVQVLEGEGTSGRPIGPARTTVSFGGEGETAVYWSGGEVPTVPGNAYTLKLSAEPGEVWIPGVAGRGDVYPLGKAYFGTEARPHSDLGFAICEENDGLSTSYAVSAGRRTILARAVGQTFVARSRNILYASAVLTDATPRAVYVRFSVHENGPGGRQIGPSKGTRVAPNAVVSWLPGEVKVTPGKTYYLHIESFDGSRFYAFEELNPYAKGMAFNDAVGDPKYDIAGWIAGEISQADQEALFRHPKSIAKLALANPSFEQGMNGWALTKNIGAVVGCDGGVIPAWGSLMFGWTNRGQGENSRTVIYQVVKVVKGKHYSFSGSVYTDHVGGRSSDQRIRLVVNPHGKPEFGNEVITSSQWYATEGEWRRGSVEFKAEADTVVVGFEFEQRWSLDLCSLYVDGAYMEQIAEK